MNNYDAFINDTGSSITKTKALKKYQKVFENKGYSYIYELIKNAKIFSAMSPVINMHIDVSFSEKVMDRLNSLMKLDASQVYPLILFLLKGLSEKKIEEITVINILDMLIKFYVRRNIVLKPKASNIRSAFLQVVREIGQRTPEQDINEVALINTKKVVKTMSVADNEFRAALSDDIYEISPKTVRFILIYLERKNGTYFNKQRKDTLDEYTGGSGKKIMPVWSLEHILPESGNLKNGWKKMISPDNEDNASVVQEKWMHKLGNLTLTGYNSEMSDHSFKFKRDFKENGSYVGLATGLFINNSITKEKENIAQKESWTPQDIQRRTQILSKLIIEDFSVK